MFLLWSIVSLVATIKSVDSTLTCLSCADVRNVSECVTTGICGPNEKCFTQTSGKLGDRHFTLGCKATTTCNGLTAATGLIGRRRRATGSDNCHQCCAVDRCNARLCSHIDQVTVPSSGTCEDNPAVDCAQLSSLTPFCADIDHAKQLCKKWCGFCDIGDGSWADWSSWASCSASCGDGHMTRTRTCTNPKPSNGGHDCIGAASDTLTCHHRNLCPINGGWGAWLPWDTCSTTCGTGIRRRKRSCDKPAPANNGQYCFGDIYDYSLCTSNSCDLNGGWGAWLPWDTCSATCGTGMRRRQRNCDKPAPANNGQYCFGDVYDYSLCTSNSCDLDGGWGSWSAWEPCSVTCGSGIKRRQRNCDNPVPVNNGHGCYGDVHDYTSCSTDTCDVNGGWGSWSAWEPCSVTCGSGIKRRQRNCDNPVPVNNGHGCYGDVHDYASCSTNTCDVDGGWGSWSAWEPCSVTCGSGIKRRQRNCDNPVPVNNGHGCYGDVHDYASCSTNTCDVSQPNVTFYIRDVQNKDVAKGNKILYKTTLVDTSGSYNNRTGVFTAPVTGLYVFTVTASVEYQHHTGLQIKTTSSQGQLGELFHFNEDHFSTSSMTGVGELQTGSQVWVQCLYSSGYGTDLFDNWFDGYQNSFQGALVRAL